MKEPQVTPGKVGKMFLMGDGVSAICNALNASTDVVEDALRDWIREWRSRARRGERFIALAPSSRRPGNECR